MASVVAESAVAVAEGVQGRGDPTRVTGNPPAPQAISTLSEGPTSFAARMALSSPRWPTPRNRISRAAAVFLPVSLSSLWVC